MASGHNSYAESPRMDCRRRCLRSSCASSVSQPLTSAQSSQTISASMGLATDAINRLGLSPEETKKLLDGMPVAYAVTYIFGTIGSAIVLALFGPALLGIDLEAACKRYEEK